jgi:hypothetical protein
MKMQDVSFRSVDELRDTLPEDEVKLTTFLRELILECIPDATEVRWNIPQGTCKNCLPH